jgi:hypothetical protein
MNKKQLRDLIREEIEKSLTELSPYTSEGWSTGNHLQAKVYRGLKNAGSALEKRQVANLKSNNTDDVALEKEIDAYLAKYGFMRSKDFDKIYK